MNTTRLVGVLIAGGIPIVSGVLLGLGRAGRALRNHLTRSSS